MRTPPVPPLRREEDAQREQHRKAFDDMVERAKQAPPMPHDPMSFRAVPVGQYICMLRKDKGIHHDLTDAIYVGSSLQGLCHL